MTELKPSSGVPDPGATPGQGRTSVMAVLSIAFSLWQPLVAIILGVIVLVRVPPFDRSNRRLAIIGIAVSVGGLVLFTLFALVIVGTGIGFEGPR
jgi:hypothetical protein